ncbi:MAG: translocation/assembly module TamB domain-containing protein [Flavobacteriales bacterium]|tara:strand:- start:3814 stop:7890 length:4077 start_codon:yes stop_codon:yes gene_type:complete
MLSADFNFNSLSLEGLNLNIYKYLDEDQTNLEIFLDKINRQNEENLTNVDLNYLIDKIEFLNAVIKYKDLNSNNNLIVFSELNFLLKDFKFRNNEINFELDNLSLKNNYTIDLKNVSSFFTYKDKKLQLKDSKIQLGSSNLNVDLEFDFSKINEMTFEKISDFLLFDLDFKNSKIITSDFNLFYNKINSSYVSEWVLNGKLKGTLNNLYLNKINFTNDENSVKFSSSIKYLFSKEKDYDLFINFNKINTSSKIVDLIFPKIFGTIIPSSLKNLGRFELGGIAKVSSNKVESDFDLKINDGSIKSSLKISELSKIDNAVYEGIIKGYNLDLSKFINIVGVGRSNFEFDISGRGFTTDYLNSSVTGEINNISYKNRIFENIEIFGQVKDQVFDGNLISNDDNLNLVFNGLVDFRKDLIDFDFNTTINNADLYTLGFDQKGNLSGEITVKLRGSNMKDLIGDLTIKNAKYFTSEKVIDFDNFYAQLRNNENKRIINISSNDIINGILIGEFDFYNLKSSLFNSFGNHYSNFKLITPYNTQNISFSLNLKPKFFNLLNSGLLIDENTFVKGMFGLDGFYQLSLESSKMEYNDIALESVELNINNNEGYIKVGDLKSKLINGKDFNLKSNFINDTLFIASTYNSMVQDVNNLKFYHTIDQSNKSIIGFTDLDLVVNNQDWSLDKRNTFLIPKLVFDRSIKDLELLNANFINNNQTIKFNIIEKINRSDYSFSFKDVSLENFTSKKDDILFSGNINGDLKLNKENNLYKGNSELRVDDLKANDHDLGVANLNIEASKDLKSFNLSFNILKDSFEILDLNGNFSLEEEFIPLNMKLVTNNFDISPFSKIGKNVISSFEGLFNSSVSISGTSKFPTFSGSIQTDNVSFKIPYLNVQYQLKNNPIFILENQSFFINNFTLYNEESSSEGYISGEVFHNKFKDWNLDLKIISDNLMILNTNASPDLLYYGKGMLNGKVIINGPGNDLSINVKGSTNVNTKLTIPIKKSQNTGDLNYLNFISSENNNESDITLIKKNGLKVDLNIEFNSFAKLEVILDSESNSKIEGTGNGNLNFQINTLGNFNIFGNFIVQNGSYFYKSLGIVNREFDIIKGSTLVWNGDPYLAEININANYEVPGGANPAILIQNTNFNRKILTNVNVFLSGNLIEMNTPSFEINFPNISGPIKSEIEYYLVDNEKKQKQAISLLYQGTFIDEVSLSSVSSQAITNNLFQKASGIIDDIFTNSDDKMNIGINYLKGDKNAASSLLNRDRLGLTLKTEISDKILINGKVGVPVGGIEENVIIGDVQIEFLLNEEGNLKARFFNKENEYQYFANDIGYTQGLGISYELEFDSFKEIFKKKSNLKPNNSK